MGEEHVILCSGNKLIRICHLQFSHVLVETVGPRLRDLGKTSEQNLPHISCVCRMLSRSVCLGHWLRGTSKISSAHYFRHGMAAISALAFLLHPLASSLIAAVGRPGINQQSPKRDTTYAQPSLKARQWMEIPNECSNII